MSAGSATPEKKFRVLIIEDDPNIARLIRVNLNQKGLDCRYASDGAAGVAEFYETKPDLVLVDLMMPIMSGHDVCRKIRETSTVPIILMTAADTEEAQMETFRCGADDFIAKPLEVKIMVSRVIAHLLSV